MEEKNPTSQIIKQEPTEPSNETDSDIENKSESGSDEEKEKPMPTENFDAGQMSMFYRM